MVPTEAVNGNSESAGPKPLKRTSPTSPSPGSSPPRKLPTIKDIREEQPEDIEEDVDVSSSPDAPAPLLPLANDASLNAQIDPLSSAENDIENTDMTFMEPIETFPQLDTASDEVADATSALVIDSSVEVKPDCVAPQYPNFEFHEVFPLEPSIEGKICGEIHQDPAGVKWRILWYPGGNDVNTCCSCYLEMVEWNSEPVREVEFVLGVKNHLDDAKTYEKASEAHEFPRAESDWGFKQFAPFADLSCSEKGFLVSDHDTKHVELFVKLQHLASSSFWHAEYDSKKETGMVGLKNQGATCYMNSLLQTLFHLPKFRLAVYNTPTDDDDTTESVSLALQRVFYRLQTYDEAVSTKELTKSFGWGHLDSFMQHDVQELFRILCDRLEEKMKSAKVENTVEKMFEGQVKSFIRCVNVDFTSAREESFYDLQLDVKGCRDIYASFKKYVEVEMLNGENQYEAEGYGKQDAEKGLSFLRFPQVLSIQLKRFEYDPYRDGMVKVHDRFEFPKTLELNPFLDRDAKRSKKSTYNLHSILVHSGDVHGGHYYAFIRPEAHKDSDDWYKYDDDRITKVTPEQAIDGSFGGSSHEMELDAPPNDPELHKSIFQDPPRVREPSLVKSFSSAYMLVYVRESEASDILETLTDEDIPSNLLTRLKAEEELAAKQKRELEEEHLYMTVKLATDSTVKKFARITKNMDFIKAHETHRFRIKRQHSLDSLRPVVYAKLGIPVERQRFWTIVTRENKTIRPEKYISKAAMQWPVSKFLEENPRKKYVLMYLEILDDSTGPRAAVKLHLDEEFVGNVIQEDPSSKMEEDDGVNTNGTLPAEDISLGDEILLFLKFYDLTKPLDDRLQYVGNILIDPSKTGSDLRDAIMASNLPELAAGREIVLIEEVQPSLVSPIDLALPLTQSELQSGDIICLQYADTIVDEEEGNDEPLVSVDSDSIQVPGVKSYFKYLINRCEVTFYKRSEPDSNGFALQLLTYNTYNEIIRALASHLKIQWDYIRLYRHNSVTKAPRREPLRHDTYAEATAGNRLGDLIFDYSEKVPVLYYELLQYPITDIESHLLMHIQPSPYNENVLAKDGATPLQEENTITANGVVEKLPDDLVLLHNPEHDLERVFADTIKKFELEPPSATVMYRLVETINNSICRVLGRDSRMGREESEYQTCCPPAEPKYYLERVPAAELKYLRDQETQDKISIEPVAICHFQLQTHDYTQRHGVPFMTFLQLEDTFAQFRRRLYDRMQMTHSLETSLGTYELFLKRRLAVLRENGSIVAVIEQTPPQVAGDEDRKILDDPAWREALEKAKMAGNERHPITIGIESRDPTPTTPRHSRRYEQGIVIRQNT